MPLAARVALVAALVATISPGHAGSLSIRLQQAARRCFETDLEANCDAVWDLSAALKEQADNSSQLRCFTSVLALEALVSRTKQGIPEPAREPVALEMMIRECP